MLFFHARIWILNVALWLMSSIHECKASLLNYHIIAMNICRLICPSIADLTSSQETLILYVKKLCFQAHFPCTTQALDCQLLKKRGYLLAQEECTDGGNSEKMAVIMRVFWLPHEIFRNNYFDGLMLFLKTAVCKHNQCLLVVTDITDSWEVTVRKAMDYKVLQVKKTWKLALLYHFILYYLWVVFTSFSVVFILFRSFTILIFYISEEDFQLVWLTLKATEEKCLSLVY